jgi:hypothetical protein
MNKRDVKSFFVTFSMANGKTALGEAKCVPVLNYVTSRKVAGSNPDEVDFFNYLILPAALWPWGRLSL